jgi:hypothetical protein
MRSAVAAVAGLPFCLLILSCSGGGGGGDPAKTAPPSDGTPPAAPVITSPARKTNDNTPRLAGTASPGVLVRVYEGTVLRAEACSAPDGSWLAHPGTAWSEGTHVVCARAASAAGESAASDPVAITVDTLAPAPPSGLRVVAYDGMVDLLWQPNAEPDLRGYLVYRQAPGAAGFVRVSDPVVVDPRYRDAGLVNGNAYRYKVTAVDDALDERHP